HSASSGCDCRSEVVHLVVMCFREQCAVARATNARPLIGWSARRTAQLGAEHWPSEGLLPNARPRAHSRSASIPSHDRAGRVLVTIVQSRSTPRAGPHAGANQRSPSRRPKLLAQSSFRSVPLHRALPRGYLDNQVTGGLSSVYADVKHIDEKAAAGTPCELMRERTAKGS
ncbi:MAG: hypothetical protein JWP21_3347, partial [Tardiphaga sp.]|nr:hypothetical protein [Tardiphaga sp.]